MTKKLLFLILFLVLLFVGGAYYWLAYLGNPVPFTETAENPGGFNPFNRSSITPPSNTNNYVSTTTNTTPPPPVEAQKLPILRLLSATPVGGMSASTTASTTLVRYVDRGAGHIYESRADDASIFKLSNTTLPRIYESYWNKNLSAVVLRYIKEGSDTVVNFYGEIRKVVVTASSTLDANKTPYEIRGKFLSADIKEMAVSPKGDRIFTFNVENGRGVGYISQFDESKKTKLFDMPLTQVQVSWPEENTLTITTKASAVSSGYVYIVDIKNATVKKVFGGTLGLTTKTSTDSKQILFSSSASRTIKTSLYNTQTRATNEVIFKTFPEKCVWSNLHKNEVYCAVPTEIPNGLYPDDWYKGTVSFVDQIWHLDTLTGEVHLLANLVNLSDRLIDATNLTLDPKENFLYFINKNDLSLWSLDLNK